MRRILSYFLNEEDLAYFMAHACDAILIGLLLGAGAGLFLSTPTAMAAILRWLA